MDELASQLLKGGINLAVTLVGLGMGWLVGQRLTYQWNLRQKHRESDLATAQDLQRVYGDFFAIWKLWNSMPRTDTITDRVDLLRRAADGEGLLERVFIKLATERRLSQVDRDTLGRFRQGYQKLRHSIEVGRPLDWPSSDHPSYLAFKRLGVAVTLIVRRDEATAVITNDEAFNAIRDITSNKHEGSWAS